MNNTATFPHPNGEILIRPLEHGDSLEIMTELLHRAYKQLLDRGFEYVATHQSVVVTRDRVEKGRCWIAEQGKEMVATLTLYPPGAEGGTPWYEKEGVGHFGQFAVESRLQGSGLGSRMLDIVEAWAKEEGMKEIACDTAEGAKHLIAFYEKRGYRFIEYADWKETNYRSVILSKGL